jgi:hypothetical protein
MNLGKPAATEGPRVSSNRHANGSPTSDWLSAVRRSAQLANTPVAAPSTVFSTTAGSDIYMYVFNSQSDFRNNVAPIQSEGYNTSGSQAMHFNDQIGSLKVIGYIGASGGHLVS